MSGPATGHLGDTLLAEVRAMSRDGTAGTARARTCPAWMKDGMPACRAGDPGEVTSSDVHSAGLWEGWPCQGRPEAAPAAAGPGRRAGGLTFQSASLVNISGSRPNTEGEGRVGLRGPCPRHRPGWGWTRYLSLPSKARIYAIRPQIKVHFKFSSGTKWNICDS